MQLSLIIPVHNEEEAIPVFLARVIHILQKTDHELVFVDDGSYDNTVSTLLAFRHVYPQIRLVELSRNFGKEAALTAGFSYAAGDAVVPIDCDLQDPPELIPEMVAQWRQGYQVVHAVRRNRDTDTWTKRTSARIFYRLMSRITEVPIPDNVGDFQLMDRKVVNALLSFPERNRFMKGLVAACGFKHTTVEYDRTERVAGASKFSLWRLWNFALDGITGFSTLPLRIWTYIGATVAAAAFLCAIWIVIKTLLWGVVTPGYATLLTVMLMLGGLQLVGLGILGEYVGRIVSESKRRPLFLVANLHGFSETGASTVIQYETIAARASR
ncbi:MAG: glycosyltransferase family 2 protein [Sulfuricaulis sp.]